MRSKAGHRSATAATDAPRRADGPSGVNTDLTEAGWGVVAGLFERRGGHGPQRTRSTAQGGMTGFDTGKKGKGRKRHILQTPKGCTLAVAVTANV